MIGCWDETDQAEWRALLAERLERPVRLLLACSDSACGAHFGPSEAPRCRETWNILEALSRLSDGRIRLECVRPSLLPDMGPSPVEGYPAIVVMSDEDYGLRHYGAPVGYELAALLNSIFEVSAGRTDLKPRTKRILRAIDQPMSLKVFVSPSCPFCPVATHFANQFAMENNRIFCESVNVTEFPDVARKYGVRALPTVVINDKVRFVGMKNETEFLNYLLEALDHPVTLCAGES